MRPSAIFVPVVFLLFCIVIFYPKSLRPQAAVTEILPSTSVLRTENSYLIQAPSVLIQPVFPGLGEFAITVINGDPDTVVGVFVEDLFAFPVIQQPKDQPAYVSSKENLVTQFFMPNQYGVIGLLAHNYLSGDLFNELIPGDEVVVIYGDGHSGLFRISHAERFQALNPLSPYSDFINTSDGSRVSSAALFNHIYTNPNTLVFQTCIEVNGDSSWGRLFVTAQKDNSFDFHLPKFSSISNN